MKSSIEESQSRINCFSDIVTKLTRNNELKEEE